MMPMGKVKLERRDRLHRVCKSIIDGGPRSVDDYIKAQFKTAVLRCAASEYLPTEQAVKNIYQSEDLVADAFDVIAAATTRKQRDDQNFRSVATGAIYPRSSRFLDVLDDLDEDEENARERDNDDDGGETDVAKAHEHRGPHQLAGALVEHLHDRLERRREAHGFHKSAKEEPMDTQTELIGIMKDCGGPVALCKAIVDRGRSPCGEFELVAALSKRAVEQFNMPSDRAFARLYESEESVRRACQLAKAGEITADPLMKAWPMPMSLEPMVATGASGFPSTRLRSGSSPGRGDDSGDVDSVGVSDAYEQLTRLAEQQRRTGETAAKAFERVYLDPANRHLAEAERAQSRPRPTTSFPFPR